MEVAYDEEDRVSEKIENQFGVGEYHKWECGCSDIIFFDHGPSFSRILCGNNHERIDATDKRGETDTVPVITH